MRFSRSAALRALCGSCVLSPLVTAINLNLQDDASIRAAASIIAYGMMNYYSGNETGQIPGLLPGPYYWWEAGAMFGSLIDYWYYTGDTTYNDVTTQGLQFQVGPDRNYMPPNQTASLGNDDQAFWGLAAMSAAEVSFPNPDPKLPQWLALAQAVFVSQIPRWDDETCGGGLKWQIFSFNLGYTYKNSISNGCFFQLGARLGAYTNNATYLEQATKAWDWSVSIGLVNETTWEVFDGTEDTANCTSLNHIEWSYNTAVYLLGAATMWNQTTGTSQQQWADRVTGLLGGLNATFFPNGTLYEAACEPSANCNYDQQSFKAYTARWMAATTKVAPWTAEIIIPMLETSAAAAAKACTGGDDGNQCGMSWTTGAFDGWTGVGQQMSALEVIQSTLIETVKGPLSNTTGGTSQGDPNAGAKIESNGPDWLEDKITMSDRAGAWVLTALMLIALIGWAWWLVA